MKKTIKFFAMLAVLLFAASCQNKGLDGEQSVAGKLNLTATIVTPEASRVSYDVDNAVTHTITPSWTVGDKIIGWDDQGEAFTFEVASVDGTGRAVLDDGGYVAGSATTLYAIYSPGKTASDIVGSGVARTLSVDLGAQSGVLDDGSPVLMCATATIAGGSASLDFENQTAIIGVTRFKLPAAATLTSISVDGLITAGTFEVDGGGNLVLTPATAPATATATGSWATGAGDICETAIYFATLPTAGANIVLNASDGANEYRNISSIAETDIEAGSYYYMAKNLSVLVADVNGEKYFTIADAFAAANAATSPVTITLLADCSATARLPLDGSASGTGAVTLDLNGHTLTTTNQLRMTGRSLTITDNSSSVLAEQGAVLSSYASGRVIYLETSAAFTLLGGTIERTSTTGNYQTVYAAGGSSVTLSGGKVVSHFSAVYNQGSGSTTINGNAVVEADSTAVNQNTGTLLIEGSPVISGCLSGVSGFGVRSQGEGNSTTIRGNARITGSNALYCQSGTNVTISGSPVLSSNDGATVYVLQADVDISGGTFSRGAGNGYVVYTGNASAVVTISGGTFTNTEGSASANPVVYAYTAGSRITVTGGYFSATGLNPISANNGAAYVTGGFFNKALREGYAVDSEANEYVNVLNTEPATTSAYPFTVSPASSTPTVAKVTQSTYNWNHGSVESALKCADQRAAGNGIATVFLLTDITAVSTMNVSSGNTYMLNLDLNGHNVTSSISPVISSAGKFTLKNTGATADFSTTGSTAISVTAGSSTFNGVSVVAGTTAVAVSGGAGLEVYESHIYGGSTADFTNDGGTIALSSGWYRNEPDADWVADGYQKASSTEVFNTRSYSWQLDALPPVVEVNGVGYPTWNAAVAAATAYSGGDATVTLTLVDDIASADAVTLNHASKPIVLDLNGYTLSTDTKLFIQCSVNSLTITDGAVTKGKITSSESDVVFKDGTGTINIEDCVIECTKTSSSNYYTEAVIRMNSVSSSINITGAVVYSTAGVTTIQNSAGTLTITDSEISSGTLSTGLVTVGNGGANAKTTINSGSFFTSATNRSVIYAGSGLASSTVAGPITINGGYFYAPNGARCFRGAYAGTNHYPKLTLNAAYYNLTECWTNSGKDYHATIADGKSEQSCSVVHRHETTSQDYTYTFKVDTTPEP